MGVQLIKALAAPFRTTGQSDYVQAPTGDTTLLSVVRRQPRPRPAELNDSGEHHGYQADRQHVVANHGCRPELDRLCDRRCGEPELLCTAALNYCARDAGRPTSHRRSLQNGRGLWASHPVGRVS